MPNLPFTLSLGLIAGCAGAVALPADPPAPPPQTGERSPAELDRLLARYDAMPAGAARDELALAIDKVAAQRYATSSRMYWHTDLASATATAKARHRPILALRMLGRLDEDMSCANSRLFRTTLYANTAVSKFLRDNFVLYWSSERSVPRVTIDYGDGRKLESTTTGNSAHYVLDEHGTVLDVLPGLYAPTAFRTELQKSLDLAARLAKLEPAARTQAIAAHHRRATEQLALDWQKLGETAFLPDGRSLLRDGDVRTALAQAQRATMSKMYIEVPQLRVITAGTQPGTIDDDETALWAAIGQKAWRIAMPDEAKDKQALAERMTLMLQPRMIEMRRDSLTLKPVGVFDAASIALITKLHNAGPVRASANELATMLARLEQHVVADSALNQFKLRPAIHNHLIGDQHFETVNAWIYDVVFHTPKTDAWLGLLPRTDFTGLPGDGVVMR